MASYSGRTLEISMNTWLSALSKSRFGKLLMRKRKLRQTMPLATAVMWTEPWLPIALSAAWWVFMYPGLFGEDSILNLTEARFGPVSVWFTAWWIYLIRLVTVGMRIIPLLTLFGVLTLSFAIRQWAWACFPRSSARALALCLICASPLVGALGIQIRHDIELTAGLLLTVAVATRVGAMCTPLRATDIAQLALAAFLVPTGHTGVPVATGAAIGCLVFRGKGSRRAALVFLVVAAAGFTITQVATFISGNRGSVDRMQSVEWAITDISCVLSKDSVVVSSDDWKILSAIATPADWPQPDACRFMDKYLFASPSFQKTAVGPRIGPLMHVWLSLALKNPLQMIGAHVERVRLFLPPFVGGIPRNDHHIPFIHSTILPNDFDLHWRFPRLAETVRLLARTWNALVLIVGNVGLWLIALLVVAWRMDKDHRLRATLSVAVALDVILVAVAPMSEARYGLFILICGQTAALIGAARLWISRKKELTYERQVAAL